jgi:hypothetical protein
LRAQRTRVASGLRSRVIHQERWFTVVELGLAAEEAAAPPRPVPKIADPK